MSDSTTSRISEAARDPVPSIAGVPAAPITRAPPLAAGVGPLGWARANLFNSVPSTAVTLVLLYFLIKWAVSFFDWGVLHAVWSVPYTQTGPDPSACREAKGVGACWAVIADKYRFILFGRYPYDEQWRPAIVIVLFISLYAVSAMRRFWRKELALIWIATLTVIGVLMWGGVLGLSFVPQ